MVERFRPPDDEPVAGEGRASGRVVVVTNPLSSQHSVMRQSLLGSLLEVVATNLRQGRDDVAVFEIGKGYGAIDEETTHEWWRLGVALTGSAEIPAWNRPRRTWDFDDAKGLIELLAQVLGVPTPRLVPLVDDPVFHPGRAACAAGEAIGGRVGELHPGLLGSLELRADRVVVAELAIAGLSGGRPGVPRGATPARHPAVERDLAVIVDAARPAETVDASIRRHAGPLLVDLRLFDIYRGRPLTTEQKSLAYRLEFQATDRTLTEAEVDAAVAAVTDGLAADVDGRLRT
jgi:phenylalanyl-tRNA synthetase beta chain